MALLENRCPPQANKHVITFATIPYYLTGLHCNWLHYIQIQEYSITNLPSLANQLLANSHLSTADFNRPLASFSFDEAEI